MRGLLRRAPRTPKKRIFFATDLHGSEQCFRKFLNAGAVYEADFLIIGGDILGKRLVPIVEDGRAATARNTPSTGTPISIRTAWPP